MNIRFSDIHVCCCYHGNIAPQHHCLSCVELGCASTNKSISWLQLRANAKAGLWNCDVTWWQSPVVCMEKLSVQSCDIRIDINSTNTAAEFIEFINWFKCWNESEKFYKDWPHTSCAISRDKSERTSLIGSFSSALWSCGEHSLVSVNGSEWFRLSSMIQQTLTTQTDSTGPAGSTDCLVDVLQ